VFADRDAVADGDLVGADEDVFDEQAQDALAFFDGGDFGLGVELGEESFEVAGQSEVGVAVGELAVKCLDLVAQVGFSCSEVWHAGAQLVDSDQLLAERFDHRRDPGPSFGQCSGQSFPLRDNRIGCFGGFEPLVDLGSDQVRVSEHAGDVFPDDGVEVVGADRLVGADPPTG